MRTKEEHIKINNVNTIYSDNEVQSRNSSSSGEYHCASNKSLITNNKSAFMNLARNKGLKMQDYTPNKPYFIIHNFLGEDNRLILLLIVSYSFFYEDILGMALMAYPDMRPGRNKIVTVNSICSDVQNWQIAIPLKCGTYKMISGQSIKDPITLPSTDTHKFIEYMKMESIEAYNILKNGRVS